MNFQHRVRISCFNVLHIMVSSDTWAASQKEQRPIIQFGFSVLLGFSFASKSYAFSIARLKVSGSILLIERQKKHDSVFAKPSIFGPTQS
jgi:hypothetical protein